MRRVVKIIGWILFGVLVIAILPWLRHFALAGEKQPQEMRIMVDQCGYHSDAEKIATLILKEKYVLPDDFQVVETDSGKVVLQEKVGPEVIFDQDSKEKVIRLCFSKLNRPGKYILVTSVGDRSYPFEISEKVYAPLFYASMRGFYYQRCGMALTKDFADKWFRAACHTKDAFLWENGRLKPSPGGWHDAGDYGKKVVPGAVSAGIMLKLFEMFPAQLEKVKLNIPSGTLPDMVTEIKYELDWLLTMQREDGAVYHLITTKTFPPAGTMPGKDTARRFIVPPSTAATANFAAVMALASRVYAKYDPAYSKKLLQAAISAWNFLDNHKTILPKGGYKDPSGIKGTGAYDDDDDRDERFWAAGELLTTTGDGRYNDYIKKAAVYWQPSVVYPFSWKDVHVLGIFSYLQCDPKLVDADIRDKMLGDLLSYASRLVAAVQQNGFLVALGPNDYYWGSNGVALCNGIILLMANKITPNQQYFNTALDQLHYIMGRNALNRSFVTGFGSNPPRHPLHTPSIGDDISEPVPGLLVGGPNDRGDDKYLAWQKRKFNLPSVKCYLDDDRSYSSNEVSIYWNALLAFVSGYVTYCQP